MIETLNETNFLIYAAKNYDNLDYWDTVEFYEDLNRIKYIKKIFTRYKDTGEIKERLIINHLIILKNVFGVEAMLKMLFFKLNGQYQFLKPFLEYMDICPTEIKNIGFKNDTIYTNTIEPDKNLVKILKELS